MSKIGIVVDPHLADRHRCRTDNFFQTALNKLEFVAKENDYVIILGDLFHLYSNSDYIFNRVWRFMSKYQGKFIAIPGNHDLLHENYNALDRTTLGSLALTGALKLEMDTFKIDNACFQVSHVLKDLSKIPVDENNSKILIGHNYVQPVGTEREWFTREELGKLNYRLVFLGHDHQPHEEELINYSILIRMGSLTRIDAQPYNKDRKIYYYQLDSETLDYEKREVPSKEASEVYTAEAFSKTGRAKEDISFVKIGDVLSKFKKTQGGINSLHERLKKIATDKEIEYIKTLHRMNNVSYF